jgi:hypothetical protein
VLWRRVTAAQVAEELIRTFVTPLDRICLRLSDDAEAASTIELVQGTEYVRGKMLQRLAARAARRERSLFPSAKADLQAAFHFLDSAVDAQSTFAKHIMFLQCAPSVHLLHQVQFGAARIN